MAPPATGDCIPIMVRPRAGEAPAGGALGRGPETSASAGSPVARAAPAPCSPEDPAGEAPPPPGPTTAGPCRAMDPSEETDRPSLPSRAVIPSMVRLGSRAAWDARWAARSNPQVPQKRSVTRAGAPQSGQLLAWPSVIRARAL